MRRVTSNLRRGVAAALVACGVALATSDARAQIVPPVVLDRVAPEVPAGAAVGEGGRVVLAVWVSGAGAVDTVRVVTGADSVLTRVAVAAVRRWRYAPATDAGRPVGMWTRASLRFEPSAPSSQTLPTGPDAVASVPAPLPVPSAPADSKSEAVRWDTLTTGETCEVFESPQPVRTETPRVTDEMLQVGGSGSVVVRALVGADGRIGEMQVVTSFNVLFERAATSALARWRFSPARCDDRAIAAYVTVPIRFRVPPASTSGRPRVRHAP